MLNDFRTWLRASPEERDAATRDDVQFVDAQRPLCFVLDQEVASSKLLSGILQGSGLDARIFGDSPAFIATLEQRTPDLIFLDVPAETNDAIDAVFALGEKSYRGPVQIMGSGAVPVMETVKRMGERHSLQMLPPLKKPFDSGAIQRVLKEQRLQTGRLEPPQQVSLREALAQNWIEFWYQPKIDLRRKQLAGVETFARLRHPQWGTLPPGAFVPGADAESLTHLTEQALICALTAAFKLSQMGINLRLAVNISVSALATLPIHDMVRLYGPRKPGWPGLILDITEEQIIQDPGLVRAISERLAPCGIKLAIDDFGRGQLTLAKLRDMDFAELKLDRAFVTNCGAERTNAAICKSVVDLAHNFGSVAVAVGVEKAADVHALQSMGCDLGQGFLFGEPMPEDKLFALLRERSMTQKQAATAGLARRA